MKRSGLTQRATLAESVDPSSIFALFVSFVVTFFHLIGITTEITPLTPLQVTSGATI